MTTPKSSKEFAQLSPKQLVEEGRKQLRALRQRITETQWEMAKHLGEELMNKERKALNQQPTTIPDPISDMQMEHLGYIGIAASFIEATQHKDNSK